MLFCDDIPLESPSSAYVSLESSRYGFSLCNFQQELAGYEDLQIDTTDYFNWFGNLDMLPKEAEIFLSQIGPNDPNRVRRIAQQVHDIVTQILAISGRETAWVSLRSTHPDEVLEPSRWHMDGPHYRQDGSIQYKFLITLQGAHTRLYKMPTAHKQLRTLVWDNMQNQPLMNEICANSEMSLSPKKGEGVFIILGDRNKAALHSIPPPEGTRLFLSILPCSFKQLQEVEKLIHYYQPRRHYKNPSN